MEPIAFAAPGLGAEEIAAVTEVLEGPRLVHGPRAKAFEEAFAARAGARHGVTTSSCTAALHLSLVAAGVGPGSRVVVPAMTHVATAHAVEYCGATPVFVDVRADTGNVDEVAVAGLVAAGGVDAVLVVHYLGLPVEMGPVLDAAGTAEVPVVEDCALAVDATWRGRVAGTMGLTGCFSFYPAKHLTTAEGGMLLTSDDEVAASVRQRKAFGYDQMLGERKRPGVYDVEVLGYNYRMSEVHAAIGLAQLAKLDGFQAARAANHKALAAALADRAGPGGALEDVAVLPDVCGQAVSSHYCLNVVLPADGSVARDDVVRHLGAAGVGSSVHYPSAVPQFRYYRERYGYRPGQHPVAERLAEATISLPVGPHLGDGDIERIATAVADGVAGARKGRAT